MSGGKKTKKSAPIKMENFEEPQTNFIEIPMKRKKRVAKKATKAVSRPEPIVNVKKEVKPTGSFADSVEKFLSVEKVFGLVVVLCAIALLMVGCCAIYVNFLDLQKSCVVTKIDAVKVDDNKVASASYQVTEEKEMPVIEDNLVYLTTYNEIQGVVVNGKFMPILKIAKSHNDEIAFDYSSGNQTPVVDVSALEKKELFKLKEGASIFDLKLTDDEKQLVVVLKVDEQQTVAYKAISESLEAQNHFYILMIYDLESLGFNSEELVLASWSGAPDYQNMPLMREYFGGEIFVFEFYPCLGCGASAVGDLHLYNLSDKTEKKLGRVSAFELINASSYKYKEYLEVECAEADVMMDCFKDPLTLPWKVETF
jgi:hypothetical protein